jgi:hypothetical protein
MAETDEANIIALLDGLDEHVAEEAPAPQHDQGEAEDGVAGEPDGSSAAFDGAVSASAVTQRPCLERAPASAILEEHSRLQLKQRQTSSSDVNVSVVVTSNVYPAFVG